MRPGDRDEILRWLRSWGCRHLRVADHKGSSRALRTWATRWLAELPIPGEQLTDLSEHRVDRAGAAFGALAGAAAARSDRAGRLVTVTFGPTAAAKALYAFRPEAFPPWDEPIRSALGLGGDHDGYAGYLRLTARLVRTLAAHAGVEPSGLPAAVGRSDATAARLIDEYLWLRLTRGARAR